MLIQIYGECSPIQIVSQHPHSDKTSNEYGNNASDTPPPPYWDELRFRDGCTLPVKMQGHSSCDSSHHGPTALRVLQGVLPYHLWQSDTPDNLV